MLLFSANSVATPVNINTADAQKIADSLKMIGEKKAQSIIEYRTKNGQFKKLILFCMGLCLGRLVWHQRSKRYVYTLILFYIS